MSDVGFGPLQDQLSHRSLVNRLCNLGLLHGPTNVKEDQFCAALEKALDELYENRYWADIGRASAGKERG